MSESFRVVSLASEATLSVVDGTIEWIPLRRRLGARAFGTNAYRADAGEQVIEDHVESPGQEEMYVLVAGAARFTVGGEELEASHGDVLFLPDPEVRRAAVALEDGTIVLGVGGWPDRPYHSLPWEPIFLAAEPMRRGEWSEAARILESDSDDNREHPRVRYRLAQCYAQLGEHGRAREELNAAIEALPELRDKAEADDLLKPIRG